MKKPVIIVIALIYILAIVVVGFLGIPSRVYNPETFVTDISLVFDDKLTAMPASEEVPYRYRVNSSDAVTFNITAKVVPNEATLYLGIYLNLVMLLLLYYYYFLNFDLIL